MALSSQHCVSYRFARQMQWATGENFFLRSPPSRGILAAVSGDGHSPLLTHQRRQALNREGIRFHVYESQYEPSCLESFFVDLIPTLASFRRASRRDEVCLNDLQ